MRRDDSHALYGLSAELGKPALQFSRQVHALMLQDILRWPPVGQSYLSSLQCRTLPVGFPL